MPTNHGSPLEAALSYYSHIVTVNAEGDSSVSEDTLEGLGMKGLLLNTLFGSILRLAQPPPTPSPSLTPRLDSGDTNDSPTSNRTPPSYDQNRSDAARNGDMTAAVSSYPQAAAAAAAGNVASGAAATSRAIRDTAETAVKTKFATSSSADILASNSHAEFLDGVHDSDSQVPFSEIAVNEEECEDVSESRLMSLLPEPGYFAAGALSGGISRTATAPIDRLKVYLLVDSKSKTKTVLTAAKGGYGLAALRQAGTPVTAAITDLYKTGGFRTFFAGKRIFPLQECSSVLSFQVQLGQACADVTKYIHREWPKCHQDHA